MASTFKEKEVKTRYPVEEGLTAGTTRQSTPRHLKPEVDSLILDKDKRLHGG